MASNCATVANVPLVGSETLVAPIVVNIKLFAPLVAKLPPSVIVLFVLATPVPPFSPDIIPSTAFASIFEMALFTNSVFAIVPSFEFTIAVGTRGAPVNVGLIALTTSPVPVVAISSTIPLFADVLPNTFPVVTSCILL